MQTTETIDTFYSAFSRLDTEAMAGCYTEDAQFDDEVFSLRGREEVMGMWRMLCQAVDAKGRDDWKLVHSAVQADATQGSAHWDADYRFSATGRLVHNSIDAQFAFAPDGRIRQHHDRFDFWRWSRQALGPSGALLGWTPMMHNAVRRKANANLQRFLARPAL